MTDRQTRKVKIRVAKAERSRTNTYQELIYKMFLVILRKKSALEKSSDGSVIYEESQEKLATNYAKLWEYIG